MAIAAAPIRYDSSSVVSDVGTFVGSSAAGLTPAKGAGCVGVVATIWAESTVSVILDAYAHLAIANAAPPPTEAAGRAQVHVPADGRARVLAHGLTIRVSAPARAAVKVFQQVSGMIECGLGGGETIRPRQESIKESSK